VPPCAPQIIIAHACILFSTRVCRFNKAYGWYHSSLCSYYISSFFLPWRYSPGWAKASFFGDFFPKVSWSVSVHSVVSGRITDRTSFCSILPEPSGRQSGDLGEKWPLEFCLRTLLVLLMPEGVVTTYSLKIA
jgi:hypothetical protein